MVCSCFDSLKAGKTESAERLLATLKPAAASLGQCKPYQDTSDDNDDYDDNDDDRLKATDLVSDISISLNS